MPTYDERPTRTTGGGHGLPVYKLGAFPIGGLICWENWMPLERPTVYALGEDLHVTV